MATQVAPKRRRGRPPKEESTALALDRAIIEHRADIASLVKLSTDTLKELLTSSKSSDKVKEGVAKYILEKAEKLDEEYKRQDDDTDDSGSMTNKDDDVQMPLTTVVREYVVNEDD